MVKEMKLYNFLFNEDGGVGIDWTVLVAGLIGVSLVVSAEVVRGVDNVTDEYDGINTGEGMMTMFVNTPNTPATVATLPEETEDTVSADEDDVACDNANPGNDKCVGNAGETPNGDEDAWGDGSNGQGDVNGNAGDDGAGDDAGDDDNGDDGDDDDDDDDDGGWWSWWSWWW